MDKAARIPIESREEFDRWFWDHGSMERPGDTRSQRPSALQAEAPAELSPGHSIDHGESVGYAHGLCVVGEHFSAGDKTPDHVRQGPWSIDNAPPIKPINAGWYRRRAEDLGDLAAELIYEGLDGTAYGQAKRAAHYGRIALDLYEQRRRGDWIVPGHAGNFL